jgi:predicted alpha-1,2-mannosidase
MFDYPSKSLRYLTACALSLCSLYAIAADTTTKAPKAKAPIDYVDNFLGTEGDGWVYPGATLPFGFVQASPDTGLGSYAAGYKFTRNITGFSQQHLSGMGGPLFGEVALLPMTGDLVKPADISSTGKSEEAASPGYYTVKLAPWNTKAELTVTQHVALHRYTFPEHQLSRILVDVGACLYGVSADWKSSRPIGGEVKIDADKREVSGFMQFEGGRYEGHKEKMRKWKVYFAARFDTAFDSTGTWDDSAQLFDGKNANQGKEIGAYLNFKTKAGQVINSQVAVSFHSVEQARGYFAKETPTWDFDLAKQQARAIWEKTLSKIEVEGGSEDQRKMFYTAMYRLHVTPNNWTGEAPLHYDQSKPYYENILCLWDTFRTVNPMHTLINPQVQTDIVNTLLSYYKNDGWTGDAHSAWSYEHVQNGSSADIVIADAYVKKLPGVDWKLAYEAIRKNAFVDQNPNETIRPYVGRYRLDDYRKYNYLPSDIAAFKVQGVSRTLEYVYNDFSVLTLARQYGTPQEIADLESRMLWYKNLWDSERGFMRGKNKDGSWTDPFKETQHETGSQYYEGHAWTWSWFVPHDNQGLINLHGGKKQFVEKLTTAVDSHYEAYNEPGMLQTFQFIHAGRPDLTQKYVRKAMTHFNATHAGLPGNDDSGTTSTWLMWAMLGLYPNAGQDYYYLGTPTFAKATIHLGNGKKIVINAPKTSDKNLYVSKASLNGKPWKQAWLRHSDIINGAQIDFSMSDKASSWGAGTPPPSLSAPLEASK